MNITFSSRDEKTIEEYDYRDSLKVKLETEVGVISLNVHDGEREDNSLSRNFSDCYNILDMLKMAYEAGKSGEEINIELVNGE